MKMLMIKIADCKKSATNVKGRTEGKEFDDLVASIKEKGVLVPILVRKIDKTGAVQDYYEVIAGNRRLAAAKESGITVIPAQIIEANDVEAREAQIVENLQRQDIHPLDEGELYRQLIEKSKPRYEAKDIALKVGKSETYIRQRLGLTNLTEKVKKYFREGKINISFALVICRLEDNKQQDDAIKEVVDYGQDLDDLKSWIERRVYNDLSNKPWAKDAKLSEMVGDAGAKPENLFGDKALGTDPAAYAKQMAAFIEIKIREAKDKGQKLLKISTSYGTPDSKDILGRDQYRFISSKNKDVKEKLKGIVVEGDERGRIFDITTEKDSITGSTLYKKTDKEIAERKKQVENDKKAKAARAKRLQDALDKVKWPLSEKHLNALLTLALEQASSNLFRAVSKRHELEPKKEKNGWGDGFSYNYSGAVKDFAKNLKNIEKIKLVFELLIDTGYDSLRNGIGQI